MIGHLQSGSTFTYPYSRRVSGPAGAGGKPAKKRGDPGPGHGTKGGGTMDSKHCVFVLSADGSFVQHGPARASEAQARSVARLLARRLGWVTVWGTAAPAPADGPLPDGLPTAALAGLSPVWKDATLAAQWAATARTR